MKDPLNYTYDGLEREINLLEIHLKEALKGDEAFCKDCIDKHISIIRGFALEGPSFTQDKNEQEKFLGIEKEIREIKGKDYKKYGVELARKVRDIRKDLFDDCPDCSDSIKNATKHLNTKSTFNNYTHSSDSHINDYDQINKNKKNMVSYTELGMMNAGQFAAEGVRYLAETNVTLIPYEKYVTIGGGIGLQALGLFWKKMPKTLRTVSIVAGSNLLAAGVVKMIRTPAVIGVAGARVAAGNAVARNASVGKFTGQPNGRVFGGRVTATNIPTEYARAGILAGAQAFGSPEHADLIRVD